MKINEEKSYKKISSLLNGEVFKVEKNYFLKIDTPFIKTSVTGQEKFNCVDLDTGKLEYYPEDEGVIVFPNAELTL